ncbi:putative RNA recognition motif domain, nucleotide-binding alpha-beta plait domain superfamily [Helianthus annuus]|nr:putative RNA recognition motif domain, nucleotide-binding alpha-beta plait domain superfamily [Helianthus annuus]
MLYSAFCLHFVVSFQGEWEGSPVTGPIRMKKILVGGLASTVTKSDFKNCFERFGSTTDAMVMYDHNTQRPQCSTNSTGKMVE